MNGLSSLRRLTFLTATAVVLMVLGATQIFAQKFQIIVKAPGGGEQYAPGDEVYIAFYLEYPDWPAEIGNWVTIEYNNLEQKGWNTIEDRVDPYTNEVFWRIPDGIEGGKYQIRVREVVPPVKGAEPTHFEGYSGVFVIEQQCTSPFIVQHPQPASACMGQSHTFQVTAAGGTMQYQWRRNGVPLATTFSNTYTVAPVTAASAGSYDVVITDLSCGITAFSTPAQLTVLPGTVIETQLPSTITVCEGGIAQLSIETSGTVTSWQWRRNGVNLADGRDSVYVINGATATSAGVYDVVVGSTCGGPLVSSPTNVVVNVKPRITQQPVSATLCPGENGTLSVAAVGTNLTYQWYRNGEPIPEGTSSSLMVTAQSGNPAALYHVDIIQSGPNPNNCDVRTQSQTVSVVAFSQPRVVSAPPANVDVCLGSTATLTVDVTGFDLSYTWMRDGNVIEGVQSNTLTIANASARDAGVYSVRVSGTCGLSIDIPATTVRIVIAPVITSQSSDVSLRVGESATVMVESTFGTQYQWYRNGQAVPGAVTPTLAINNATLANAGVYHAIVRNSCGATVSAYVRVRVIDPSQLVPELSLGTAMVTVGDVPVGHTASVTVAGMFTNTGSAALDVQSISVSNPAIVVTPSRGLPATLQPGESMAITVSASASTVGAIAATVTVTTNAPVPTEEFAVSAMGVLRYTVASQLDYAEVSVGESKELCVSIENTSGVDISLSSTSVAGRDAAMFTVLTPMPVQVPAGATSEVCIRYAPTVTGEQQASLAIVSADGGNSSVAMIGRGVPTTSVSEALAAAISIMPNPTVDRVVFDHERLNIERIDVLAADGSLVFTTLPQHERTTWNLSSHNGATVASGIYTVVFRSGSTVATKPLVIVR